jgi:N-acetylmuramic acid 6-phosphate (MurNAc-6-P) etherase
MTDKLLELSQPLDNDPKNVRLKAISGDPDSAYAISVDGSGATQPVSATNLDIRPLTATDVVTVVNYQPLTPYAPAAVSVGVASAQAVAALATRKGLILINTSANYISLGFGAAAVLYSGVTLNPAGGSFELDQYSFTTGAINAIASGAASNLGVQEFA